ncbi:hypothetical protein ACOMHN_006860 [Nucella lapillus]
MNGTLSFFVIALGLITVCAGEVTVHRDTLRWREARKACRKQTLWGSCDLISRKRLDAEWSKLGLSGEDHFWVGGRRLYHWLWDDGKGGNLRLFQDRGCYKLTVPESRLRQPRPMGPARCHRDCGDHPFIYLQGENCFCSDTLEGEAASRDRCPLSCDGSDDKCGANEAYFSVYSLPQQIKLQDSREDMLCAASQVRHNRLAVDSTDCSLGRQYFCQSDLKASAVDSRSTDYGNAVDLCASRHNSTLLSLSLASPEGVGRYLTAVQTVLDKMGGSFITTFWLPLRRHVRPVWVDGEKGEEGGEFGNCLAVTPRTASYRLNDLSCSHAHGYICDCSDSAFTTVTPGKNGGKTESKTSYNSTLVVIVVVIVILLVTALVGIVVFLKRRMGRSPVGWPSLENPVYKESS